MTEKEYLDKFVELFNQWRDIIHNMPLRDLKNYIKTSPTRAVLHELELNHRIHGGKPPMHIIAEKMTKLGGNFKNVNINMRAEVTFTR